MRHDRYHVTLGIVSLVAAAAFLGWVGMSLAGGGGDTFEVTVTFDRAGQLLKRGADVKLRGILVGKVSRIALKSSGGVEMTLSIDSNQRVPNDVTASIRGKTLFGEKFVSLVDDQPPGPQTLKDGDVIDQSRTVDPFELEDVLRSGMPVLDAIEPKDLGGALSALAEGVSGQEEEARRSIDNGLISLKSLNSSSGLESLLSGLDESSSALAAAAPALASSADGLNQFNAAIIEKESQVKGALRDVPQWLGRVGSLMTRREKDFVDLSLLGFDVIGLVKDHRVALPSTVTGLKNFTQAWATSLSVGCTASGESIRTAYPPGGESLRDSTCWQIWDVDGEDQRPSSDYYNATTWPRPDSTYSGAAFTAQLKTLLALNVGEEPSSVAKIMFSAVTDEKGLIPEGLL